MKQYGIGKAFVTAEITEHTEPFVAFYMNETSACRFRVIRNNTKITTAFGSESGRQSF